MALPKLDPATDDTVSAAREAVTAAETVSQQECKTGIGGNCRKRQAEAADRRTGLTKAVNDKAVTDQAHDLDAQISVAEAALAKVDVRALAKEVDPQSVTIAQAFGISAARAAFIGQAIFAVGIEIGSGLGLWTIFGHGAGLARPDAALRDEDEVNDDKQPEAAIDPPARPVLAPDQVPLCGPVRK